VYYGLINEEDAQCFSVQSSVEEGSFILATGAALLAFINTFVNKAVAQYFRDIGTTIPYVDSTEEDGGDEVLSLENDGNETIQPVPVLFSDRFRWCLVCPHPREV
jgi:hypothetical protein